MSITIITTGGTIDKNYASQAGTLNFHISDPVIPEFFRKINSEQSFNITEVCRKDSLEMEGDDRAAVLDACRATAAEKILITHGTDTMIETAMTLRNVNKKTIVLFGAASPAAFRSSDAEINFGVALGAVQSLPTGVYVTMNGVVYEASTCYKDPQTGQFKIKDKK